MTSQEHKSLRLAIPPLAFELQMCPWNNTPASPRSVISFFLAEMGYRRPFYPSRDALEQDLYTYIDAWQLNSQQLDPRRVTAMVIPSAAMGDMSYHGHDYRTKFLISLFTFFMIYIDDLSGRNPTPFAVFQQYYATSKSQLDPVLDHFVACLRAMWTFYDAFTANAIVSSALEFVNGCYLESLTMNMKLNPNAERYPYFLRSKTGVAQAYAMMIFPLSAHLSPLDYIQAAPSISYWIDITNDILSFHKEELAQEVGNYVHLRATIERKKPAQVHFDLVQEALRASASIESTLSGGALDAWLTFKTGYITFHVTQDRYKLCDMLLGVAQSAF